MKKIIFFITILLLNVNVYADDLFVYTSLGDSITAGYGVQSNSSYPFLVSKYLDDIGYDAKLNSDAINGIESFELLEIIRFDLDIINDIEEANLITISIGSNDILKYLSVDMDINVLNNIEEIVINLENNIADIVDYIYSINSDVMLVMLPFYNPYNLICDSEYIDIINKLNYYKNNLNEYLVSIASNYNNMYVLSDLVVTLETVGYVNVDYVSANFDPHPSTLGHTAIADAIVSLSILEKENNFNIFNSLLVIGSCFLMFILIIFFKTLD